MMVRDWTRRKSGMEQENGERIGAFGVSYYVDSPPETAILYLPIRADVDRKWPILRAKKPKNTLIKALSFPRTTLSESCSLLGTDNVCEQIPGFGK